MSRKVAGFKAWLVQRISAIFIGLYFVYIMLLFSLAPPVDYVQWRYWLADPLTGVMMALFFLALLAHAWIGVRDVVIDYIHPLAVRLTVLTGVALLLIGCGIWLLRILVLVAI